MVLTQTRSFGSALKKWFIAFGVAMIESRQESANRRIAEMQLHRMTDRELQDIGITRGDIKQAVRTE